MSTAPQDVEMLGAPADLVNQLIGPLATGYILEVVLYGSFCTLFVNYCLSGEFARLPGRSNRVTLAVLFGLVTVASVLTCDALWKLAVEQKRTIDDIIAGPTESCMLTLLGGLTGAVTQAALAKRAGGFIDNRKLRWAFYTFLVLVVTTSLFGSLAATVIGFIWAIQEPDFANSFNWSTSIAIWLWSSAVADCVICATLAWSLRRRVAGFNKRTDSLLKRLAWLSVRSASYTAVVAVGGAIAGSLYRDTVIEWSNLSVAFWAPMPPLYGFAFFSTTSSSRRAIEDAFRPAMTTTHVAGGEDRAPLPVQLPTTAPSRSGSYSAPQNEKLLPPGHAPRAPAPAASSRRISVFERVRAACGGMLSSSLTATSTSTMTRGSERAHETVEVDLERGSGSGSRANDAERRRKSLGTTTRGAGAETKSWRASTHSQGQAQAPRELRIQVDQLVETRVEWCEEDAPPETPW